MRKMWRKAESHAQNHPSLGSRKQRYFYSYMGHQLSWAAPGGTKSSTHLALGHNGADTGRLEEIPEVPRNMGEVL